MWDLLVSPPSSSSSSGNSLFTLLLSIESSVLIKLCSCGSASSLLALSPVSVCLASCHSILGRVKHQLRFWVDCFSILTKDTKNVKLCTDTLSAHGLDTRVPPFGPWACGGWQAWKYTEVGVNDVTIVASGWSCSETWLHHLIKENNCWELMLLYWTLCIMRYKTALYHHIIYTKENGNQCCIELMMYVKISYNCYVIMNTLQSIALSVTCH